MLQFWNGIMENPEAKWIVYGTLLIFAVLIAVYVSSFFRNMAIGSNENEDLDLLSEFRNLRDQGHLDNHEYDRLKTVFPDNAKHELLRGIAPGNSKAATKDKNFMTLAQAERTKQASQSAADEKQEQQD